MTIKDFVRELHDRVHASFLAVNEKDPNGQVTTTKDTRLTDEVTDADVAEILSLASRHAAEIKAGPQEV